MTVLTHPLDLARVTSITLIRLAFNRSWGAHGMAEKLSVEADISGNSVWRRSVCLDNAFAAVVLIIVSDLAVSTRRPAPLSEFS